MTERCRVDADEPTADPPTNRPPTNEPTADPHDEPHRRTLRDHTAITRTFTARRLDPRASAPEQPLVVDELTGGRVCARLAASIRAALSGSLSSTLTWARLNKAMAYSGCDTGTRSSAARALSRSRAER